VVFFSHRFLLLTACVLKVVGVFILVLIHFLRLFRLLVKSGRGLEGDGWHAKRRCGCGWITGSTVSIIQPTRGWRNASANACAGNPNSSFRLFGFASSHGSGRTGVFVAVVAFLAGVWNPPVVHFFPHLWQFLVALSEFEAYLSSYCDVVDADFAVVSEAFWTASKDYCGWLLWLKPVPPNRMQSVKELQTNLATYNEQLDQVRRLILNLFFLLVGTVESLSRAGLKMASVPFASVFFFLSFLTLLLEVFCFAVGAAIAGRGARECRICRNGGGSEGGRLRKLLQKNGVPTRWFFVPSFWLHSLSLQNTTVQNSVVG